LTQLAPERLAKGPVAASTSGPAKASKAAGASVDNGRTVAEPVRYIMAAGFDKKLAKAQTGMRGKTLATVMAAGKTGISNAESAAKAGVNLKTSQSNMYQLRHAGLIVSSRG
jgi:hypothetical protein